MIFYACEHMSAFSQCLTLRLLKHREEKAILAVTNFNSENLSFLPKLLSNGLFDYVFECKPCGSNEVSKQKIIEKISATYDELLCKQNINIKDVKLAYVFYDVIADITLYLADKKINIVTCAMYPDHLCMLRYFSKNHRDAWLRSCSPAYIDCLSELYPVSPDKKATAKILVYPESEIEDNDFVERYDFNNSFLKIKDEDKYKTLTCFRNDLKRMNSGEITLLLPNSMVVSTIAFQTNQDIGRFLSSNYGYNFLYAVICDYFYNNQYLLVCKSHPHIKLDNNFFNKDCLINIDDEMPIEFLRFVPNIKIQEVLAVETTATGKIKDLIKTDKSLGTSFLSAFHYIDKLYVIQKIISEHIENNTVFYYGIPEKTCLHLYDCNFQDHKKCKFVELKNLSAFENADCYIVNNSQEEFDKPQLSKLLKNTSAESIVFFIDTLPDYEQLDDLDNIVPLLIKRIPKNKDFWGETIDQIVYVFSKNRYIRETLKAFAFTKHLPFTEMELLVSLVSKDQIDFDLKRSAVMGNIVPVRGTTERCKYFPHDLLKKDSKVVIYGAGDLGHILVNYLKISLYCNVVLWIDDMKFDNERIYPSSNLLNLSQDDYDYIVLATIHASFAETMKHSLTDMGILEERIIFCEGVKNAC